MFPHAFQQEVLPGFAYRYVYANDMTGHINDNIELSGQTFGNTAFLSEIS